MDGNEDLTPKESWNPIGDHKLQGDSETAVLSPPQQSPPPPHPSRQLPASHDVLANTPNSTPVDAESRWKAAILSYFIQSTQG